MVVKDIAVDVNQDGKEYGVHVIVNELGYGRESNRVSVCRRLW